MSNLEVKKLNYYNLYKTAPRVFGQNLVGERVFTKVYAVIDLTINDIQTQ